MNQPVTSLAELQRALASIIMTPLTPDESMRPHAADGRSSSDIADQFIAPNNRLTAFERLEIYNRQYWFRLLGSLAEDFPALRALLGSRKFDALAVAYLTAHPSRSFTLRNLGAHLVSWLTANPQFAGRRHALAVDVAHVEWAFIEAFDEAERKPLTLQQIAQLDSNSGLALQPHVRLLSLNYAADELAIALHNDDKKQPGEAGSTREEDEALPASLHRIRRRSIWVAAHRIDHSVYYRRLIEEEYLMLAAIQRGEALADAIDAGFLHSRIPESRRAHALQQWFAAWAGLAWLCVPIPDISHNHER